MNRNLLAGLALLLLSACSTSPARDVNHGSDLDVLVLGVKAMTKHREPAGTIKIPEQATDNEKAWELLLDLDDVKWLSNGDKDSIYEFVSGSVERIKESRRACSTWDKLLNLRECR